MEEARVEDFGNRRHKIGKKKLFLFLLLTWTKIGIELQCVALAHLA